MNLEFGNKKGHSVEESGTNSHVHVESEQGSCPVHDNRTFHLFTSSLNCCHTRVERQNAIENVTRLLT